MVPILARPEGRAQHPRRRHPLPHHQVPILARPEGRAQRLPSADRLHAVFQFQSSPDPKAGRNISDEQERIRNIEFQSSPDPKAGRNERKRAAALENDTVPILARPEGRAQLGLLVLDYFQVDAVLGG